MIGNQLKPAGQASGFVWAHSWICSWLRAGSSRVASAGVLPFCSLRSLILCLASRSLFSWQPGSFPIEQLKGCKALRLRPQGWCHCPHSFEQIKQQGQSRFEELENRWNSWWKELQSYSEKGIVPGAVQNYGHFQSTTWCCQNCWIMRKRL